MRITTVREATIDIDSDIANAYISFKRMSVSAVAITTDVVRNGRPVVGYGFNSNGRYSVGGLLRDRFVPRLVAADFRALLNREGTNFDPGLAWTAMMRDEKPGGHGERSVAVGVLDMALWDLVAKIEDEPLHRLLARRFRHGDSDQRVFVYAAGGYYSAGKDLAQLQDEMRRYLDLGYSVVKMKIGGMPLLEDLRRIEAALRVVHTGTALAVDANGRFNVDEALEYARTLEPYGLRWFEEPGDPLDYRLCAAVARAYEGPLATGENLFSVQDARNLFRYGGMRPERDILQFDCSLAYGLVEYARILQEAAEHGWSPRQFVPHGGHQMSLNMAAGLGLGGNESYPGLFRPFNGFADGTRVEEGYVTLPDAPGIGIEANSALHHLLDARLHA